MPNWCQNELVINGAEQDVAAFVAQMSNDDEGVPTLRFSDIVPLEDDEDDCACERWGCKWEPYQAFVMTAHDAIYAEFQTPWSEPKAWMVQASRLHPELTFAIAYEEPLNDFMGVFVVREGQALLDMWQAYVGPEEEDDLDEEEMGTNEYLEELAKRNKLRASIDAARDRARELGSRLVD